MKGYVPSGQTLHLVTVQNPGAPVPTADGGFTVPWTDADPSTGFARITTLGPGTQERALLGTVTAQPTHQLDMPWRSDITTQTRIVFGARTFAIVGVADLEERNVQLAIYAVETEGAPAPSV